HSRRAVTALKRIVFDKRFLNRIELAVFGQALDGGDFPAIGLNGELEARFHDFAVEQHRTSAALADHATDVGAGKADGLTQKMREQNTRLDVFFVEPSVDG